MVNYLAQGHRCHDRDSNPQSGDLAPELEFDALLPLGHDTLQDVVTTKNKP